MSKSKLRSKRGRGKRKSILIVEDDNLICLDIERALKGIGYLVEIARDGVEALEKIKQKTYDLIITNNEMPRMNGEQLYTEVFASSKDLAKKIMFMSGKMTDFIKSTGNSFLAKPFSHEQLIKTIKKLVT